MEPRFNEVPRDWGDWFVISRFFSIHYTITELKNIVRYVEVRSIEVPLYFPVVLFIVLYTVVLTFESVDKILNLTCLWIGNPEECCYSNVRY